MTIEPPEGSWTMRECAVSIWCSIWKRENSGVGVDQDLADRRMEVVADGADDEARFLEDQERRRVQPLVLLAVGHRLGAVLARLRAKHGGGGIGDRVPQLEQVVEVPLQFVDAAADAGGARDDAHAGGQLELVHRLAQFLPVFAFDAARDPAAAGIVRHQHQVAAGQRDKGRQRRPLVAAFLLLDLDDHFVAVADRFVDAGAADVDAGPEEAARDLLERQEAVPLLAVVHEAGFEAGLDPGDDALVDVRLALLATLGLDVDVDESLAVDDGHPEFLRVGRIEEHPLHLNTPCAGKARSCRIEDAAGELRRNVLGTDAAADPPWRCVRAPGRDVVAPGGPRTTMGASTRNDLFPLDTAPAEPARCDKSDPAEPATPEGGTAPRFPIRRPRPESSLLPPASRVHGGGCRRALPRPGAVRWLQRTPGSRAAIVTISATCTNQAAALRQADTCRD